MEVGFAPLKDSKLSTREFVALHLINRPQVETVSGSVVVFKLWRTLHECSIIGFLTFEKLNLNKYCIININWIRQWCFSLSILNNSDFFSKFRNLENNNFDEVFVKAKDRSNYLEIQCQFSGIKTWWKFIRFALEYSVSSPVFDIIAFHQASLGTRAQNSVLDCECLKSLQIYFDYLLKMIVSAWNCCKYISIIFKNHFEWSCTIFDSCIWFRNAIRENTVGYFSIYDILVRNW